MRSRRRQTRTRPDRVFDDKLQHERTALAWERTAIATIVAGALLARHAVRIHPAVAGVGVAQLLVGAGVLIWSGFHYERLHAPLRDGESPVHPASARLIGVTTIGFTASATVIAVVVALI